MRRRFIVFLGGALLATVLVPSPAGAQTDGRQRREHLKLECSAFDGPSMACTWSPSKDPDVASYRLFRAERWRGEAVYRGQDTDDLERRLREAGQTPVPAPRPAFAEALQHQLRAGVALAPGPVAIRRRPRRAGSQWALAAAAVAVVALAVGSRVRPEEQVRVASASDAVVVFPGGDEEPAVPGLVVADGSVIRTGDEGRVVAGKVEIGPNREAVVSKGAVRPQPATGPRPVPPAAGLARRQASRGFRWRTRPRPSHRPKTRRPRPPPRRRPPPGPRPSRTGSWSSSSRPGGGTPLRAWYGASTRDRASPPTWCCARTLRRSRSIPPTGTPPWWAGSRSRR